LRFVVTDIGGVPLTFGGPISQIDGAWGHGRPSSNGSHTTVKSGSTLIKTDHWADFKIENGPSVGGTLRPVKFASFASRAGGSQHSSRTRYPQKRFPTKPGVGRGRISGRWRIAISSSSHRRQALVQLGRDVPVRQRKTAGRRSVIGKRSCLGRVIALAVPVRRAGCALIILVVESGDLVSGKSFPLRLRPWRRTGQLDLE
jgi:hypothetical protein